MLNIKNKNYKDNLNKLIEDTQKNISMENVKYISVLNSSEQMLNLVSQYEETAKTEVCNILKKLNFIVSNIKQNLYLYNQILIGSIVLNDRYKQMSLGHYAKLLDKFNSLYDSNIKVIKGNSKEIDLFFDDFISYCDINNLTNSEYKDDLKSTDLFDNIEDEIYDEKTQEETSYRIDKQLKDNRTLLISEINNKVYLPYYISDLESDMPYTGFSSIEELIENEYIVSYTKYLNPIKSRFSEAYKLLHEREQLSSITSLLKSLKLAMNSELNPAVISACRYYEELNSYLNCLESHTLDTFKIFDIKYDVAPTSHRFDYSKSVDQNYAKLKLNKVKVKKAKTSNSPYKAKREKNKHSKH